MRLARIKRAGQEGLAAKAGERILATFAPDLPALDTVLSRGPGALRELAQTCAGGEAVTQDQIEFLPPFSRPGKIVCVGMNYAAHAAEAGIKSAAYPTLFARFASSLIGHGATILKPATSDQLDFEGELVAVIGKTGRHISPDAALDHVGGYSIFNDVSIRDYQTKTTQWTAGKNFDATGAFGPWFVTADELPRGAAGLRLETRLNGKMVQSASTAHMIFDVASLVSLLSEFMTLDAGDLIVTGTPAGIGMMRTPQLFMRVGDVCEVEIEGIGVLRNPIGAAADRRTADPDR